MSEEGGLLGKIGNVFKLREPEKSPEIKSPERKAQEAFYEANKLSLTEEGLQSVADFEPPNAIFDLSKLGDGTVFRVKLTEEVNIRGKRRVEGAWQYGCIVVDNEQNHKLYITNMPTEVQDERKLKMRHLLTVEDIEKHGPETIPVYNVSYEKSDLSWETPFLTLPPEFFAKEYVEVGVDFSITVHKIEVVDVGSTIKQKKESAESESDLGLSPSFSPSPQTS